MEAINAQSIPSAHALRNAGFTEEVELHGSYTVECYGPDGKLKWSDTIENLVTTAGKNVLLDTMFGGAAAATWYMGLVDNTGYAGPAVADTMASHAGWAENTSYSQSVRQTAVFAAAASGEKALSAALSFSISATVAIIGCFLVNNATKGGTTGTLYSAGAFSNGVKNLDSGDTLTVSYTARA